MARAYAELTFTPAVREVQKQQGSAKGYDKFLAPKARGGDRLGDAEIDFIIARDGFYQATISETLRPYVQFRGGPIGFLQVLDDKTIAYADFRGNRQYISTGNLNISDKISLILMDYPNQRRLKIMGRAKQVDQAENPKLVSSLEMPGYSALVERAVVIEIDAFDWNCPQHIPQRLTLEEFEPHITALRGQIAQLSQENQTLKTKLESTK